MPDLFSDDALNSVIEGWTRDHDVTADAAADMASEQWVTLPEAEEAAGVSRSAIRAWFRNDEVPSVVVEGPHGQQRLVSLDAVVARAQLAGNRVGRRRRAAASDDRVEELEQRVAELEARLADLEDRLDS